ncbi:GNAT family N-acetyltransferase [Dactylosporangium sp. NPDC050688]|uniref:GNAT family N-acetyltransferase n=1 Tax=Dactylosporangium sp. NPDC050688 TaxID=3157217 RepID=UPI0033E5C45E
MISTLTEQDLNPCALLFVATFNAPPWSESWRVEDATQRLADFLATPRAHGVGLRAQDGELLGFAIGHLERSGVVDHFLLQEMCVRPARQRHGHGTALLEALADRLPGVHHWYLLTARDSDASVFYQKNGFRPAGRMAVFVRS